MDYSSTVNLPRTSFPMKADLKEKEPRMLRQWAEENLAAKIAGRRSSAPPWILHDGPPYANGEIHIGHALNKILKDIIVRQKTMAGFRSPFVPGWDCHGLPIEHQVVKDLKARGVAYDTLGLRKACREFAAKYVRIQREGFERLGVLGDWEHPYLTMSTDYEQAILLAFADLLERGFVTRRLKPVHWCPACETALADAELEYAETVSTAVTVKFPVTDRRIDGQPLFVLIWTTTPWTLPANVAVCFHPTHRYLAVRPEGRDEWWIMVNELAEATLAKAGLKAAASVPFPQEELGRLRIRHPFLDREVRPVFDEYVTVDTGTGVVHIAPGHGEEDYAIGLRDGLPVLSPVDGQGRFSADFPPLQGLEVLKADEAIIDILRRHDSLVAAEQFPHSYPHCWRCKSPVIFRATHQWFLAVDHADLRRACLKAVDEVRWIPEWGRERMANMLADRPDWCLSRQRAWGVPIPAVTCKSCQRTLLTPEMVRHFASLAAERGLDLWFSEPASALIPPGTVCPDCGGSDFEKTSDILDVWFDSGVSHLAVLERRPDLAAPADLYLEGSDQYRGWFQSSLIPSVALRGRPPYKAVLTHGFLLDEQGRAMHKSAGNAIAPSEIVSEFGADILRLWVVSQDYREDMALGRKTLLQIVDAYRSLRNTLRFLLGNLNGFDPRSDSLPEEELHPFDLWALRRHEAVVRRVLEAYDAFRFNTVFHILLEHCATDLSAVYLNILKDRLYTRPRRSRDGRSCRTVLDRIFRDLARLLAPVLVFTSDEAWRTYRAEIDPTVEESVHLCDLPSTPPAPAADDPRTKPWEDLIGLRPALQKALENARKEKLIGDTLEAVVLVHPKTPQTASLVRGREEDLAMLLIATEVRILDTPPQTVFHEDDRLSVGVLRSEGAKCPRCWRRNVFGPTDPAHPELCPLCCRSLREADA